MNLESIMLSEIIQIPYDFTHRWNLRNKTNEQRKKDKKLNTENKLVVGREKVGGGMDKIDIGN